MKLALLLLAACQRAAPPAPTEAPGAPIAGLATVEGDYVVKDFKFSDGKTLPELRLHYTTVGAAKRDAAGHITNAVLVMHGTTGSGKQFARPQFADELFKPGQPLAGYYVILPDDIGHGASSKPSDGLGRAFPHYGYADMVAAEHALVVDGLGVDHLRLVMGTSMGCMHSFMWAEQWPSAMDAVMPLACLPVQIAGRNRQWRKMIIDALEKDPVAGLVTAGDLLALAGSAPLADQARWPTRDAADKAVEDSEAKALKENADDILYAVRASSDYDPSARLEDITAPLTLVNSADDFINPPELGIAEREIKRVARGKFVLIPASERTHGHGTHTWATFWKPLLVDLLH